MAKRGRQVPAAGSGRGPARVQARADDYADAAELAYRERRHALGVDPAAAPAMRELGRIGDQLRELEARRDQLLVDARDRGATWTQLGAVLGVSPQAVQQRHARVKAAADPWPLE